MTDKEIRRFSLDGRSRDIEDVIRIRYEIERRIKTDMREQGFAPVLELDSHLATQWDVKERVLNWRITIQGAYLGEQAKEVEGIWQNKPIGTLRSKSKESYSS